MRSNSIASRPDLSAKVRRGYEDNWRLRIQPHFGIWPIAKIDHESIQRWVNEMSESGLSPRTVRWTHTVLKMTLAYAIDDGRLIASAGRAGHRLAARIAPRPGELETIRQLEGSDRQNRAGENARARSSSHVRLAVAPSWRRPPPAAEGYGPCLDTVTVHTYANLFDDELDNIAAALDSLDDLNRDT